ncbi:hypothetical protein BLNAU_7964 [Blattamonas nauphoetae]|uniref:Uncharacterized protein n=1 Tax=Blattamonas nauphoetae TaxID=2049346 RepID=A0ABQ9Y087_9EUKA|nr:hypothetical protein BLNAU_7964 [Blattamonas nauphoetae]
MINLLIACITPKNPTPPPEIRHVDEEWLDNLNMPNLDYSALFWNNSTTLPFILNTTTPNSSPEVELDFDLLCSLVAQLLFHFPTLSDAPILLPPMLSLLIYISSSQRYVTSIRDPPSIDSINKVVRRHSSLHSSQPDDDFAFRLAFTRACNMIRSFPTLSQNADTNRVELTQYFSANLPLLRFIHFVVISPSISFDSRSFFCSSFTQTLHSRLIPDDASLLTFESSFSTRKRQLGEFTVLCDLHYSTVISLLLIGMICPKLPDSDFFLTNPFLFIVDRLLLSVIPKPSLSTTIALTRFAIQGIVHNRSFATLTSFLARALDNSWVCNSGIAAHLLSACLYVPDESPLHSTVPFRSDVACYVVLTPFNINFPFFLIVTKEYVSDDLLRTTSHSSLKDTQLTGSPSTSDLPTVFLNSADHPDVLKKRQAYLLDMLNMFIERGVLNWTQSERLKFVFELAERFLTIVAAMNKENPVPYGQRMNDDFLTKLFIISAPFTSLSQTIETRLRYLDYTSELAQFLFNTNQLLLDGEPIATQLASLIVFNISNPKSNPIRDGRSQFPPGLFTSQKVLALCNIPSTVPSLPFTLVTIPTAPHNVCQKETIQIYTQYRLSFVRLMITLIPMLFDACDKKVLDLQRVSEFVDWTVAIATHPPLRNFGSEEVRLPSNPVSLYVKEIPAFQSVPPVFINPELNAKLAQLTSSHYSRHRRTPKISVVSSISLLHAMITSPAIFNKALLFFHPNVDQKLRNVRPKSGSNVLADFVAPLSPFDQASSYALEQLKALSSESVISGSREDGIVLSNEELADRTKFLGLFPPTSFTATSDTLVFNFIQELQRRLDAETVQQVNEKLKQALVVLKRIFYAQVSYASSTVFLTLDEFPALTNPLFPFSDSINVRFRPILLDFLSTLFQFFQLRISNKDMESKADSFLAHAHAVHFFWDVLKDCEIWIVFEQQIAELSRREHLINDSSNVVGKLAGFFTLCRRNHVGLVGTPTNMIPRPTVEQFIPSTQELALPQAVDPVKFFFTLHLNQIGRDGDSVITPDSRAEILKDFLSYYSQPPHPFIHAVSYTSDAFSSTDPTDKKARQLLDTLNSAFECTMTYWCGLEADNAQTIQEELEAIMPTHFHQLHTILSTQQRTILVNWNSFVGTLLKLHPPLLRPPQTVQQGLIRFLEKLQYCLRRLCTRVPPNRPNADDLWKGSVKTAGNSGLETQMMTLSNLYESFFHDLYELVTGEGGRSEAFISTCDALLSFNKAPFGQFFLWHQQIHDEWLRFVQQDPTHAYKTFGEKAIQVFEAFLEVYVSD